MLDAGRAAAALAICASISLPHASSSRSAVARLALFKRQIIFDGALYAGGKFLSAFWRVQSSLVRQNIPGEFAAFFIILGDHSTAPLDVSSGEWIPMRIGTLTDALWITLGDLRARRKSARELTRPHIADGHSDSRSEIGNRARLPHSFNDVAKRHIERFH